MIAYVRAPVRLAFAVAMLAGLRGSGAAAQVAPYPATRRVAQVDTHHGVAVADPYRWLEDGRSEEARAWFRAQGRYARGVLDTLPGHDALLARMRAIGAAAPPEVSLPQEAGGRWFYTVRRAGEPVARGYVRDGATGAERLLVDPASVGGSGAVGANALVTFRPAPDGRRVLYGVTSGGSEAVVLRVRDVATGRDVGAAVDRNRLDVNAWLPDGRAFLYLQLPDRPAGAPPTAVFRDMGVRRHRVGDTTGAADPEVFSAAAVGLDPTLFPAVAVDALSGLAFATLRTGVERHLAVFVAPLAAVAGEGGHAAHTPAWRPLFGLADSVLAVAAHGPDLYVLMRKGAPRGRVVRTRLAAPDLATADVVVPEGAGSLQGMDAALDGVYVREFAAGGVGLTRRPWGGRATRPAQPVALPPGTSVGSVRAQPLRPGVLLTLDSWTAVGRAYRYDPARARLASLPLRPASPYDRLDGYVAETVGVPSHDGVRVPLTIVRPARVARDGHLRVLLAGYGAVGRTDPPSFLPELRPWYEPWSEARGDAGGATAVCHVRGGGYYGAAWHAAGRQATKPNSWRDFVACAEYLVHAGYTRPARLAVTGASAGGITVGRAVTERPDLFAAAVIAAGVLDAVRFETTPGGPANVREFGSVATEAGFRGLLAMSPVHHVRPGTAYPAVLLTAGLNDPRVPAWQPGKMAAALQAASTSGRPVLLRVDEAAGHGAAGTDDALRRYLADFLAFILAATGAPTLQPTAAPRR